MDLISNLSSCFWQHHPSWKQKKSMWSVAPRIICYLHFSWLLKFSLWVWKSRAVTWFQIQKKWIPGGSYTSKGYLPEHFILKDVNACTGVSEILAHKCCSTLYDLVRIEGCWKLPSVHTSFFFMHRYNYYTQVTAVWVFEGGLLKSYGLGRAAYLFSVSSMKPSMTSHFWEFCSSAKPQLRICLPHLLENYVYFLKFFHMHYFWN